MSAPSFEDLFQLGRAEMLLRRPDLFLNEGDVSDFLLNASAAMADKAVQFVVNEVRRTFIDGAKNEELDVLVEDHFGLTRNFATNAEGTLTFSRIQFTAGAGIVPAGTIVGTSFDADGNRVEFVTNSDVEFLATDLGPKDVLITAVTEGIVGNVGAAEVTTIVSDVFDPLLVVTNTLPIAGGNEKESDTHYRERARQVTLTLRRGTLDALEFGAKTVASVSEASVVEGLTGIVSVYVTDQSGTSNAQMVTDVQNELDANWKCAGTSLSVVGGLLQNTTVDVSITARAGFNSTAQLSTISAAVISAAAKLKIGETLYRTIIQTAIKNIDPDNIQDVVVNFPASDLVPNTANSIIRVSTVTVS